MKEKQGEFMVNLQRLLQEKDFKSEDEVRVFMNSLLGKVPSNKQDLNKKEQAQDLVFDAYELTPSKAKKNIEKALQIDPDCIEAYEFMGNMESSVDLALVFYEKGILIGRRIFGGKYLEKHKGMFWGFHETRPYMRCLKQYSDCLYKMGKVNESVAILEEMIELNPNDNQGVRDQLLLYLIELDDKKRFLKYAKMFEEDTMTFSLFNRALFTFKVEGESEKATKLLVQALKQNKYVAKRLLSSKPVKELADFYGIGDENEADYYVSYDQHIWASTKGANEWLKKYAVQS